MTRRGLATAAAILLLAAFRSQPLAAGVTEVVPLSTGTFHSNDKYLVQGGEDRKVDLPVPVYLIRHSDGLILFDAGLGVRFNEEIRGWWFNRLMQWPLPYTFSPDRAAVNQLKGRGILPEAVRMIVISHLHLDHAGGIRDFPDATVIVSQKEWGRGQTGRFRARLRGYVREQFVGAKGRLGLVNYVPGMFPGPFEASYDLKGDGSLLLLSTPGHTAGHQSLLVTMESGKKILLTGDAVWVAEGYKKPAPKPWLIRTFEEFDSQAAWRTTQQIHQFAAENPDVLIVPGHDPDLWPRLPSLVNPYNSFQNRRSASLP